MKDLLYKLKHDNCIYVKDFESTIKSNKEKYGNDIINYSDDGYTALMYVCEKGYFEIVEFLFKEGADINYKVNGCRNAVEITASILQSRLDYINKDGKNKYECIKENFVTFAKIIEILIKYGAEVLESQEIMCGKNESCNYIKGIYLLEQVESGNLEKLQQCIGKGLDINFRYSSEITALMSVCQKGNFEATLMLISAGADINAKGKNGKTVLNYAAEGGNTEIMKLLLAQGANRGVKE